MSIRFNPLIFGGFDLTGGGAAGSVEWKSPVADEASLPVVGNTPGDARVVLDTNKIYVWDAVSSKWVDSGLTVAAFGSIPNADGITLSSVTVGNITHPTINLEPADATNPGAVSTTTQTFSGNKTFSDDVIVIGVIDAQGGIDSTTGTLDIGATATAINIGAPGATVTIQGDTNYEHVTNLYVKDKTITINDGGGVASAGDAGLEVQEDGSITGYAQISSDRNTWQLKAPNQAGVATIDAGSAGITLDQSSHDPVTLSAVGSSPNANGATLSGQVLNLEPADATNPGVITTGAQTFGGDKTFADVIYADGGLNANVGGISVYDIDTGETGSGDILNIGVVNADTINIGSDGNAVNIDGTVNIDYTPADATDWAPAPTSVYGGLDQLADRFVSQNQVTHEPTGFPNRTDSTLSFTDSSPDRTFTISPTGVSFDFYVKGTKFTKTAPESIQIPNLNGNHYIYYNDVGVLSTTQVISSALFQENAIVSDVHWNPDVSLHTYFAEERHGLTMDGATHSYLHTVFGARYLTGLALQGFTIGSGGADVDAQFTADQGTIRDEDLLLQIAAEAQIPILYRIGQNWRKKPADAYPVIYSTVGGIFTGANGRLPYNQYTGGAWTLTQVANSDYVLVHFFATNDKENGVFGIQGIQTYNSAASARIGANAEISSLSGLPFAEFVPIGSVIFQTATSFGNAIQARVFPTDTGANYVDFRGTQLYTPAGTATTHGLLSGLSSDDHFQYLLADGTRAMAGALDMGTHQINNVVDPSLAQDAATKNYVDTSVTGSTSYFAGFDSTTGVLTEVPGYTFDDNGSLQIGAQNSLTIPAGITDYISIGISPTVSNPGLDNLSAVQVNSPINQTVVSYTPIQVYGYGTSAPTNFNAYNSQTSYTGVGTNITHYLASGSSDCTGDAIAFRHDGTGDAGTIRSVQLIPSGDAITIEGVSFAPTGTYTDATGLKVDLSAATITNRPIGLDINGGSLNSNLTFTTVSNIPTLVDSGNVVRPVFEVESGSSITGTDVLMTNLAGFMDFKDDHSGTGLLDLGVTSVGFVSQVAVDATKTADNISMCLAGLAVDATSAGGSVSDAHLYRGSAFTFGGSLTIDNLYGLKIENTLSDKATNTWGISVEDTGAENYLAKSLKIGGSTATTNNEIALEIGSNKSIRVGLASTAQRTALTNVSGLVIYDTDLNKFFGNDGSQWIQLNLSVGDIDQTSFPASDNQSSAANITSFVFSNAVTRGFEAVVTIERGSTYAEYTLKGIQKGASWEMSQDYIGDDAGIVFSITSSGQIQYTSTSTGSGATIKFRAKTV